MIRRLRWRLTAFNTAITGAILLGMTLLCLFVSERETRNRTLLSFSDTLNTASIHLEHQERLSVSWLRQLASTSRVHVSIRDGGTQLFSMSLDPEQERLAPEFAQVRSRAKEEYGLDGEQNWKTGSCVFSLEGEDRRDYYAGLALISKGQQTLELTMLYPLEQMQQTIFRQRLVVCLGVVLALGLLGLFSWIFTGKMLRPIQENQLRQTQFTAAASHELRTPVAAILSAASAMERAEPAQQGQFGQIIRREGQRLTRLIGDLLTLASADSQSWEILPREQELDMLALDVYENYLPRARERGLSLVLSLPEQDGPKVWVDRDRICQVLNILLDNALSYTPAPGEVRLGVDWARDSVRLTVSDTGPGVPEGDKKRIFERFYRGEETRCHGGHFGLGLNIAAQIARLHRGKLWVEDAPSGGARFVLELPLR